MTMRVVTVGTGCSAPSLERSGSSVLVEAGGLKMVFDLGLGALHGLLRAGVAHRDIDRLYKVVGVSKASTVALVEFSVEIDLLSTDWPFPRPPVENGHGFFASVGRYRIPIRVPNDFVGEIGWVDEQSPGKADAAGR